MSDEEKKTFEDLKTRLDEIVEAVNDESKTLDETLDLYEEAVKLGMQASSLLEEDVVGASEQEAQTEDLHLEGAGESTEGASETELDPRN